MMISRQDPQLVIYDEKLQTRFTTKVKTIPKVCDESKVMAHTKKRLKKISYSVSSIHPTDNIRWGRKSATKPMLDSINVDIFLAKTHTLGGYRCNTEIKAPKKCYPIYINDFPGLCVSWHDSKNFRKALTGRGSNLVVG